MTTSIEQIPTFKVPIVGSAATGKTTFIHRYNSGEFVYQYKPSVGASVTSIKFHTTRGPIMLEVWDTAGQEKFGGLRDGYYISSHAAIIFFDLTCRDTYKQVPNWYKDLERVCGRVPMVLVGNKVDVKDRQVPSKSVTFGRRKGIPYYDLSAKSNYNIEKPFLSLLRQIVGDPNLELVQEIAVTPAEVILSKEWIAASEALVQTAIATQIPDDDDVLL